MLSRCILITALCLPLAISSVAAGPNSNAKIAGHLRVHTAKSNACDSPPTPPCNSGEQNLTVYGDLNTDYDLYLLVLDGDATAGVAGASFGISYKGGIHQGMDVFDWTFCGDAEYGSDPDGPYWPADGSGNVFVWNWDTNCQNTSASGDNDGGVTAVIGALYVYAYGNDTFKITRRNYTSHPNIAVASCAASSVLDTLAYPQAVGKVAFGSSGGGYDPCQ